MVKNVPKIDFYFARASEDVSTNKIKYLRNSREEVLEAKMAIELAKV